MNYQDIFAEAERLEADGDLKAAYELYDNVYEAIIKAAGDSAKQLATTSAGTVLTDSFFKAADEFMMNEAYTRQALYNMGRLLVEQGEGAKAKPLLKRAVELTPAEVDYPEPKELLDSLG